METENPTFENLEKGKHQLEEHEVINIRRLVARGYTLGQLAERYGVSRAAISMIVSGKRHGQKAHK